MVHTPNVQDFPSLHAFDPLYPDFTCIYPVTGKDRPHCGNRVNKADRAEASHIRAQVLDGVSTPDHLQRLAGLSCCKRVHRKSLEEFGITDKLCQKWEKDLKEPPPRSWPIKQEDSPQAEPPSPSPSPSPSVKKETSPFETGEPGPRYNLRFHAGSTEQASSKAEAASDFVPHVNASSRTFVKELLQQLAPISPPKAPAKNAKKEPQWRKSGSVYGFTRESSPGMVKIGFTAGSVSQRLKGVQKSCGYEPQLVAVADAIPHVMRAERLVHYELLTCWRREPRCKHNSRCAGGHREWFEVDVDTAARTIKNVAEWMRLARPYDEKGYVTLKWRNVISDMEKTGVVVTSERLVKAYHDLRSVEMTRVLDGSETPAVPATPEKTENKTEITARPELSLRRWWMSTYLSYQSPPRLCVRCFDRIRYPGFQMC